MSEAKGGSAVAGRYVRPADAPRVDIVREHVEGYRLGREHAISTLIFPNGSKALWPANETDFANAMCASYPRIYREDQQ